MHVFNPNYNHFHSYSTSQFHEGRFYRFILNSWGWSDYGYQIETELSPQLEICQAMSAQLFLMHMIQSKANSHEKAVFFKILKAQKLQYKASSTCFLFETETPHNILSYAQIKIYDINGNKHTATTFSWNLVCRASKVDYFEKSNGKRPSSTQVFHFST